MSTRSVIIARIGEQFHAIFCEHEGELSYAAKVLEQYDTQEKVEALFTSEDESPLGKLRLTEATTANSIGLALDKFGDKGQEYIYIWNSIEWRFYPNTFPYKQRHATLARVN
ncbi:hypothetical protein LJC19_04875 [Oxalobacter sp. OttesenSCG-928-P03]|nr:hypothetical protein [Oxalobacter sp. OttesenSCG-928-P03]